MPNIVHSQWLVVATAEALLLKSLRGGVVVQRGIASKKSDYALLLKAT